MLIVAVAGGLVMLEEQRGIVTPAWGPDIDRRARSMWPRLDPRALRRCRHDPRRIARLVARRSSLGVETILGMLVGPDISREEGETWFG